MKTEGKDVMGRRIPEKSENQEKGDKERRKNVKGRIPGKSKRVINKTDMKSEEKILEGIKTRGLFVT